MHTSFAADVRPLFRDDPDISTMKGFGIDLSSYEEVKAHSAEIYALERRQHALRRTMAA